MSPLPHTIAHAIDLTIVLQKFSGLCSVALALAASALLAVLPCQGQGNLAMDPTLASTNRKLAGIVVPNVEFRGTRLSDAVDFLSQEARRVDPASEHERGVNIVIIPPRDVASTSLGGKRITLTLKNAPLLEILRQSAEQVGMSVSVQPYGVQIAPAQPGAIGDTATLVQITPGSAEAAGVLRTLEKTLLPNVEFRGTSLGEILEYLNRQGATLPGGGVKFSLSQSNPPGAGTKRSTLMLDNVSVLELLRLVGLQTGTRILVTPGGVEFAATEMK